MSKNSLSVSLSDEISGAAWLLEQSRPHLTARQLAKSARRELARESRYTRTAGLSRTESAEHGDPVATMADDAADVLTNCVSRDDVARCVAKCRATDPELVSILLVELADGSPSGLGHGSTRDSVRQLAESTGIPRTTLQRRLARIGL